MVNPMSLFLMSTSFLLSLILPLGVIIFLCVTKRLSFKGVFDGIGLFCMTEIVWMLLFSALFSIGGVAAFLNANVWLASLTQSAVMAVMLAFGRYYMNKSMLSDISTWRGNCAFGLGYGFAYSIMYFSIQILNDMMASVTINQELEDETVQSTISYVLENQTRLMETQPLEFLLPGASALAAILIQVALCLVVLYAIRQNKMLFVWGAAAIQTVIYVAYDLLQNAFGAWYSASVFVICAVGSIVWIVKSKDIFDDEIKRPFSRRSPLL